LRPEGSEFVERHGGVKRPIDKESVESRCRDSHGSGRTSM
jgi:hypothetical protein